MQRKYAIYVYIYIYEKVLAYVIEDYVWFTFEMFIFISQFS